MRSFTLNFVCLNNLEDSFSSSIKETESEYRSMGYLLEKYKNNRESFHFRKVNDVDKEETISYYLSMFPIYFYKNIKITFKYSNGKVENKVVTLSEKKLGEIQGFNYKYILDGKMLNKNSSLIDLNIKHDITINLVEVKKVFDAFYYLNGEKKTLKIPEDEFVVDLKRKLNMNEDSYIKVNGKAVSDHNVLISNYMDEKKENEIKLIIIQNKGNDEVIFVDVSKNNTIDIQFSYNGPKWRESTKGINILGECKIEKCEAFKKQVIYKHGLGTLDLVNDIQKIKCPMCKKNFHPDTVGFSNCKYTFCGTKMEDDDVLKKIYAFEPIIVGNYFKYFIPKENGKVTWRQLKLIAEENTETEELKCGLCKKDLGKFFEEEDCRHKFHKECLEKFFRSQTLIKSCVICQL